jgi:hypothetical protein
MTKLVIQEIALTDIKASVKMVMKDGDLNPIVVFEGHMAVLQSTGFASVSYGNDALTLDNEVTIKLPLCKILGKALLTLAFAPTLCASQSWTSPPRWSLTRV